MRPLIDRAVALDVQEARFARAIARAAAGDRAGALADLTAYVAREPNPEHLAEARALRAEIDDQAGPRGDAAALAPRCWRASACSRTSRTRRCARWAAPARATSPPIGWSRSAWSTNTPIGCRRRASATSWPRTRAGRSAPPASCAPRTSTRACPTRSSRKANRRDAGRGGRGEDRRRRVGAGAARRGRGRSRRRARAHRARAGAGGRQHDRRRSLGRRRPRRQEAPVGRAARRRGHRARPPPDVACCRCIAGGRRSCLGLLARRRWGGHTVAQRAAPPPALFPDVARAVGELRHDVLKHRAERARSARGRRTRRAPRSWPHHDRTAPDVGGGRDDLRSRWRRRRRGHGITLRALAREPVFGALHRDLARAETLLAGGGARHAELAAIDERLRGPHADALAELLQLGPRTRLDAATLSAWIASVEASARQRRRRLDGAGAVARRSRRRLPGRARRAGRHLHEPAAQRAGGGRGPGATGVSSSASTARATSPDARRSAWRWATRRPRR